ncbi:MAG: glycerophosphodiester phosphodiesterase [Myxococcales bacterium]|nr:glycerophosphodiester phosphodiesterase [Myxococcales bacterium]
MADLILWAHRGSHRPGGPLENTLPAFERALAEAADGVELDVHPSRDGVPMVFHDETLERLVPGDTRALAAVDAAELRALELRGGFRMPTLAEVLDLLLGRLRINIEIKDAAALGPVLAVLPAAPDGVLLSSFDHDAVRAAADRAPRVPRAALTESGPRARDAAAWPASLLRAARADAWHPHHGLVDRARVERAHACGCAVNVWTVNDAGLADRLAALGVDGVFTDHPADLRNNRLG